MFMQLNLHYNYYYVDLCLRKEQDRISNGHLQNQLTIGIQFTHQFLSSVIEPAAERHPSHSYT